MKQYEGFCAGCQYAGKTQCKCKESRFFGSTRSNLPGLMRIFGACERYAVRPGFANTGAFMGGVIPPEVSGMQRFVEWYNEQEFENVRFDDYARRINKNIEVVCALAKRGRYPWYVACGVPYVRVPRPGEPMV